MHNVVPPEELPPNVILTHETPCCKTVKPLWSIKHLTSLECFFPHEYLWWSPVVIYIRRVRFSYQMLFCFSFTKLLRFQVSMCFLTPHYQIVYFRININLLKIFSISHFLYYLSNKYNNWNICKELIKLNKLNNFVQAKFSLLFFLCFPFFWNTKKGKMFITKHV